MAQGKKAKAPQILVKGRILNSPEVFVIAENLDICKVTGGIIEVVLAFMAVNYAFMFKYPFFFKQLLFIYSKTYFEN